MNLNVKFINTRKILLNVQSIKDAQKSYKNIEITLRLLNVGGKHLKLQKPNS